MNLEFNFKEKKVLKKTELKISEKKSFFDFCPSCQSKEIYEVFINKLWRCNKCKSDLKFPIK